MKLTRTLTVAWSGTALAYFLLSSCGPTVNSIPTTTTSGSNASASPRPAMTEYCSKKQPEAREAISKCFAPAADLALQLDKAFNDFIEQNKQNDNFTHLINRPKNTTKADDLSAVKMVLSAWADTIKAGNLTHLGVSSHLNSSLSFEADTERADVFSVLAKGFDTGSNRAFTVYLEINSNVEKMSVASKYLMSVGFFTDASTKVIQPFCHNEYTQFTNDTRATIRQNKLPVKNERYFEKPQSGVAAVNLTGLYDNGALVQTEDSLTLITIDDSNNYGTSFSGLSSDKKERINKAIEETVIGDLFMSQCI